MTTPAVSVIVPHGGRAAHLATTLAALAEQRYPAARLELIVVRCPAAEPAPRRLGRPGGAGGPTLVEITCDVPGFAPASARNAGLRVAGGQIVVSLDDDVVAPPDLIARHVERHLGRAPVATFGLRRFKALPGEQALLRRPHARLAATPDVARAASNRPGHDRDWRLAQARRIAAHPHPYHLFHGCNLSYGRAAALEVGGWCTDFDGGYGFEDVDFGARLHRAGVRIGWEPRAEVLHLESPGTAPSRRREGRGRNLALVLRRVPGYERFRRDEAGVPPLAATVPASA